MKLAFKSIVVGLFLILSSGCLNPFERGGEKVPLGPEAPFSLVVYFKLGASAVQVESFKENVLSESRSDGRGRDYKEGIGSYLRLSPEQGNGHWGFAITYYAKTTDQRRSEIKQMIASDSLVHQVFENVAPNDIRPTDLK